MIALVDLNTLEVLRVEDHGVVPVPPESGNFDVAAAGALRDDIAPLEITQPDGPGFTVEGRMVRWQRWQLHVGFTPREGLVLNRVGYQDGGRLRSIMHRASLSEMCVPYGDPSPTHYFKNAFDAGENGVGVSASTLTRGCDCLGEIVLSGRGGQRRRRRAGARSPTPSACTRRTSACCGGTSSGGTAGARCGARGGW